jgi:folate-dependent phosphoribosylglycinamide formyltransferase PurN
MRITASYSFVGAFTDRPASSGIDAATQVGIPLKIHDFKAWREKHGVRASDIDARAEYFADVVEMIREWDADVLMFSGFMLITTDPLISAYEGRVLNVHPADLRIMNNEGKRRYVGPGNAVIQAQIEDGLVETRSTVHVVTHEVDGGPIVAVSPPLAVLPEKDAHEHQEKMKYACDGPAYREAFLRIASGAFPLPAKVD